MKEDLIQFVKTAIKSISSFTIKVRNEFVMA